MVDCKLLVQYQSQSCPESETNKSNKMELEILRPGNPACKPQFTTKKMVFMLTVVLFFMNSSRDV